LGALRIYQNTLIYYLSSGHYLSSEQVTEG
jgi:hypothetical protein